MTQTTTRVVIGLAVLLGVAAVFVFNFLANAGQFRTLKPRFAGTCVSVPLEASAEDIRIDAERGIAYLSYLDRRAVSHGKPARGTVMLLDMNLPEPRPRAALTTQAADFRPQGMSLYVPAEGPRRLFVINRLRDGEHAVEIFEESVTGAFAPVETIRDPLLSHANAIAAIGPRQFYVANDSGASSAFERLREFAFRRGRSTVTHFDGEKMRVVASGLQSASGIAVSNHGLWVYVGEAAGNRLHIFDRDSATGELASRNWVQLEGAPDNVTIDADGTVWIAAHPKVLALLAHLRDPSKPSPTAIYRLRTSVVKKDDRLSIPYLDLGEGISAGSVAAVHAGRMLVGSSTQHKALLCRLPENL